MVYPVFRRNYRPGLQNATMLELGQGSIGNYQIF
jgi:hypothetical protein